MKLYRTPEHSEIASPDGSPILFEGIHMEPATNFPFDTSPSLTQPDTNLTTRDAYMGGTIVGFESFVGVNVIRYPETGYPLMTLMYKVFKGDTTVVGDGVDQPGVVAFLTELFEQHKLSFETAVIERGTSGLGARFEFESNDETMRRLREMYEYIEKNPLKFKRRGLERRERKYNLRMQLPKDDKGLLTKPTAYLASKNVNLRYMRAEKDPLGEFLGHEVRVFAQLESPPIEVSLLEKELLAECPQNTVIDVWDPTQPLPKHWDRAANRTYFGLSH